MSRKPIPKSLIKILDLSHNILLTLHLDVQVIQIWLTFEQVPVDDGAVGKLLENVLLLLQQLLDF
jgi:hypothetical protein